MSLTDGLILLLQMNDSGGEDWIDDSPSSYDMSESGVVSSISGKIGNALGLAGSGNLIKTAVTAPWAGLDDITIAFWCRADDVGNGQQSLLNHSTSYSSLSCSFRMATGSGAWTMSMFEDTGGGFKSVGATAPTEGVWTHYIVRYIRNDNLYCHVNNGSPTSTALANFPYASQAGGNVYIGSRTGASDRLNGGVDQFAVWNRDLSSDERAALYGGGNGNSLLGINPYIQSNRRRRR